MIISPKQPYFVIAASRYYKAVVMNYGISHFYSFQKESIIDQSIIAVPDGCIDILFCCDEKHPSAEVCGSVFQPTMTHKEKENYYFGIRFLPGQNFNFKNIKMQEIMEHEIPLIEVMEAKDLVEKITSSRDFNYQINVFLEHYLKFYEAALTLSTHKRLKNYLLRRIIETTGQVKVNNLAEETGYSIRSINRIFTELFGIAPKVFCKIMRFQNLLHTLNNIDLTVPDSNLTQIAIDLGYFDQSHMIKDFYELTNTTPGKYLHLLKETEYKKRIIIV